MHLPILRPLAKQVYRRLPGLWTLGLEAYQQRHHGGKRNPARLDVMTSIGGKDLDVLQVLLQSLSETHAQDQIEFWLFHLHLPPEQLAELDAFCDGLPNLTLHVIHVQESREYALLSKLGSRPFGARFLWFTAHLYLPAEMSRIIYLDPLDTIVTDDLMPFMHQPLMGKYLAACREAPSRPPHLSQPAMQARGSSAAKILRLSKGVLNSGAIVLNLDQFRQDGIGVEDYIKTATWAQEAGLTFGDQGLYSLTHGSNYVRAHDRYNYRFHDAPTSQGRHNPAVIHFAGRIAKPFHLRLTPAQEQQILDHLEMTGAKAFRLNPNQTIRPYDLAYYRLWWQICARTPVYDRIAPIAGEYASRVLAEQLADTR